MRHFSRLGPSRSAGNRVLPFMCFVRPEETKAKPAGFALPKSFGQRANRS